MKENNPAITTPGKPTEIGEPPEVVPPNTDYRIRDLAILMACGGNSDNIKIGLLRLAPLLQKNNNRS